MKPARSRCAIVAAKARSTAITSALSCPEPGGGPTAAGGAERQSPRRTPEKNQGKASPAQRFSTAPWWPAGVPQFSSAVRGRIRPAARSRRARCSLGGLPPLLVKAQDVGRALQRQLLSGIAQKLDEVRELLGQLAVDLA